MSKSTKNSAQVKAFAVEQKKRQNRAAMARVVRSLQNATPTATRENA